MATERVIDPSLPPRATHEPAATAEPFRPGEPAPRRPDGASRLARPFRALAYRDYRLLWLGAFTSTTGTWMQTVAQSWLVFSLTGSAFLLGVDGFLAAAPMLFFSLFGGVLADRIEKRRVMLVSQLLQMTFAFSLAGLVALGRVEVWHVFVLSFLTGTAQAFSGPAYVSLLPTLVRKEDVPNAIALNSMQFNLARVIGPVIAGFAFVALGAAACFALNGLSFVAVIVALLMMSAGSLAAAPRKEGRTSVLEEMRDGFAFVAHHGSLSQLCLLGFVGTFLGGPIVTMLPVVARDVFAQGPRTYSWLLAAYGIGSVAGAIVTASVGDGVKKGRLALGMQIAFAVFLFLFALSPWLPASLVLAFLAGASVVGAISMYSSLVQLTTTDAMRGRVMSIFMLAFRGGMPLGALVSGYVAQTVSVQAALAGNAIVLAVIAGGFMAAKSRIKEI
ncbi:MAG: MFS transporter [Thermoanaerobaculia bacterium]|nr:MFS transporter [Thermoanaerobaculia bacterium]